jgi:transcriptional regulator with XRE-family HTH domain
MEGRKKAKKKKRFVDPRVKLIGARIKALRIAAGYKSQEKAALAFEISRSQWADYEKGVEITLTLMWRIWDALEVTPEEFFAEGFD